MSADEAVELMQRHLPSLTKEDAELLNRKFRGFPLVIPYACQLMASGTLSAAQLNEVLETSAPVFLSKVPSGVDSTFVVVLGEVIKSVSVTNNKAFHLLECLAFLRTGFKVSQQFLVRYMSGDKELTSEVEAETALIYTQAVRTLQDFSLIEVLDADYLFMHRLVGQALRILLSKHVVHVTLSVSASIDRAFTDRYVRELNALDPVDYWAHHKFIHDKMHLHDIYSAFLASSDEDRMQFTEISEGARELVNLHEQIATHFCQISEQLEPVLLNLAQALQRNLQDPAVDELLAALEDIRAVSPLATVCSSASFVVNPDPTLSDDAYGAVVLDEINRILRQMRDAFYP
jgi:hypothetical protein